MNHDFGGFCARIGYHRLKNSSSGKRDFTMFKQIVFLSLCGLAFVVAPAHGQDKGKVQDLIQKLQTGSDAFAGRFGFSRFPFEGGGGGGAASASWARA